MRQEMNSNVQYVSSTDNEFVEIDLLQMFKLVLSKIVYIIIVGVVAAIVSFLVSTFIIEPKYQSNAQLYIINRQNDGVTTYNDLQTSTQLVKDYKVLVTSNPVLEKVISNLNLDMSTEKLKSCINISIESDSRVLEINVTTNDPYMSKNIADQLADVSSTQITQVMQIEGVNVIQYGKIASRQSSPNIMKNVLLALLAGIVIASACFVVRFIMDDTIKSSEDIEKYLGISTLALIPYAEESDDTKIGRNKSRKKNRRRA